MNDPLFIGIDLGTARSKIGVFDRYGTPLVVRIVAHTHNPPLEGVPATQDATLWWRKISAVLRTLRTLVDVDRLVAIAICGQGPTLVTTDQRIIPCGDALTWFHTDAEREAASLTARLNRSIDTHHLLAKALYLDRVDPQPRRRWYLQAWDYLASRLCGIAHTSARWDEEGIAATGLSRSHFPPYIAPGQPVGVLRASLARSYGIPEHVQIVAGTNDGIAACLGSGVIEKGRSVLLGGTSGGFVLCWDPIPGAWAPPPDTYPEPPHLAYLGATISSSGLALDWLASLFTIRNYEAWLQQAISIDPGAQGLVFLPYLSGLFLPYTAENAVPLVDPTARGVFFGLSIRHTRSHLLRAILEGVAYSLRQLRDALLTQGGVPTMTSIVGGQAHSRVWNQIKADVLGIPLSVPRVVEAGALGAACLAAAGSGFYPTIWDAATEMVQVAYRLDPEPTAVATYTRAYHDLFVPLYPQVRHLFPHL